MGNRVRKRVYAFYPPLRAPDGSAFIKCELCCGSVLIALADMHDCKEFDAKKIRKLENRFNEFQEKSDEKKMLVIPRKLDEDLSMDFHDQPRSPFCFFMEEFSKNCEGDILIEVYQRGFEAWKNMSIEERIPYEIRAEETDAAYQLKISEEIGEIPKMAGDEVNSPCKSFRCCNEDSSGYDAYSDYESD
ncbi:hypothetical protein LUZ60_013123 [Juncus effusus]|nr:hypothetical protein LUZ60_013123 [Juncus effusus]